MRHQLLLDDAIGRQRGAALAVKEHRLDAALDLIARRVGESELGRVGGEGGQRAERIDAGRILPIERDIGRRLIDAADPPCGIAEFPVCGPIGEGIDLAGAAVRVIDDVPALHLVALVPDACDHRKLIGERQAVFGKEAKFVSPCAIAGRDALRVIE